MSRRYIALVQLDLIVNPHARRLRQQPALVAALQRLSTGRARVHITSSVAELEALCAQLARRSRLVLFAGGDGSLMAGVSALARHCEGRPLPAIAPISVGTAGTVARNWGMHGQPLQRLRRLLCGSRRLLQKPSLKVVARHADASHTSIGFIFGTGLVAHFIELYNSRGAPGYAGAAKLVARIFVESFANGAMARRVLTPLACRLETDGALLPAPAWSLICASVVTNLGVGMRLTYRAGEDATRPHLVASSLPPRRLGPRAPWVLAGRRIGGAGHVDQLTPRFRVTFDDHHHDGGGPFVLDGELMHARDVEVSAGPLLSLAVPA